jgi:hypothetical protein
MRNAAIVIALVGMTGAPAAAQLANPSPAAHGMAGSFTAAARGYSALSWNPAALGLSGGPQASATALTVFGLSGFGPVSPRDVSRWLGETVPLDVRQQWLEEIDQHGGQRGALDLDLTIGAFQAGRFAGHVSTTGRSFTDIPPGLASLILNPPQGPGGVPINDVTGSVVDGSVYSTAAIGFGIPLPLQLAQAAVGVTGKYTIGHALGVSQPSSITWTPTGGTFQFPLVYTPVVHNEEGNYWIRSGGGFGLDLAVAAEQGRLALAAVAHNVVNTFAWDHDRLRYRPLELTFADGGSGAAVDWQPLSTAPPEVRALVDDATFRPSFTVGAAFRWSDQLLVTADARAGTTDGIHSRPPVHAGTGVEVRPLPWLPVQAGVSWVNFGEDRSGLILAGGLGVQLGSFHVSGSVARRDAGAGAGTSLMISLISHTFQPR